MAARDVDARYNTVMPEASTKTDVRLVIPDAADHLPAERWTYHPLRDDRPLVGVCGVFVAFVLILVIGTTGKWYLGFLGLSAAAVVFWRRYLPVAYETDARGLRQTVWKFALLVPWKKIDRAELKPNHLRLVPHARNRLFAQLRSIQIPCGERLIDVQRLIEIHAPWAASWARDEENPL
jgi:hypothetical protein